MINNMRDSAAGFEPQTEDLNEMALIYAAAARERLAEANDRVKGFVAREPLVALGVAFGVGVFLGWLIKRR